MAKKRSSPKAKPAPVKTLAKPAPASPPEQVDRVSFQNLGLEWKVRADGSAELVVAYDGPLAGRDEVVARAGTWRQGSAPWTETRELPLRRQGKQWVGAIPVGAGAPVAAVQFVFRAGDDWDNGGRAPLGYYEWSPVERRVEVR